MRPPFRRRDPQPPVNVRLVLDDGTEIPVSCAYIGKMGRTHQWRVLLPEHPGPFVGLNADEVAGNTALIIPMERGPLG